MVIAQDEISRALHARALRRTRAPKAGHFYQVVTLEQPYSFEKAVRAGFLAAREEGILLR